MILSIGVDTVEIDRFSDWHKKSTKELQRIFSDNEITYCLKNNAKSTERFAVRFAAREAVYKALSPFAKTKLSFLLLCKNIEIKKIKMVPVLYLSWDTMRNHLDLPCDTSLIRIHLSLTHAKITASAFVILEYSLN